MEPIRPPLDPIAYYDQLAVDFALRYDAVTFEAVHPNLAKHLPSNGRVLDIGSGSGRDSRGLAARGLHVTAVEPSVAFRRLGCASSSDGITWIDDRLPMLALLDGVVEPYDFILCSAVLMLINTSDLDAAFQTMARLLANHGRLAVNVRDPMLGEPAAIFHLHSDAAIFDAADSAGLACVDHTILHDALGRQGYVWRGCVFSH